MANRIDVMTKKILFAAVTCFVASLSWAQNYQAIHGSPYAGSLGVYNNPASSIHSHYNWDLTLFSVQAKLSSNSFNSTHPLYKLPQSSVYISDGDKQRYIHLSQDMHVLNGRLKLNRRQAIAFGFNVRNYVHLKSKSFRFVDTISSFNSFLKYNRPAPSLGGNLINNSWAEIYASYSQVIRNTNTDQLSAGITLKGIRGISGVYAQVDNLRFSEVTGQGSSSTFFVTDPSGKYGYSSNYDRLDNNNQPGNETGDFLKYTQGSLGIDLGAEYIIKNDYAPQFDDVEQLEYVWKVGVSVLDLGRNLFRHGSYSRQFSGVLTDVSEEQLENKFEEPDGIEDFYDSLGTVVQQLQSPASSEFYIWQPTRLVINVDRHLYDNLFINGELSVNFFSSQNKRTLHTRELNLLTVTPRWETSMLGMYLPVQVNTQGKLLVGTAFKAGPLLIGIHDWRWLLSKKHVFNGGAYLALVVRNFFPSSYRKEKRLKNMDCPPF